MDYKKVRENAKQFQSVTSLSVEEFDELLARFELVWRTFIYKFTLDGKPRKRKYVPKSLTGLNAIEDKLFFILSYQKNNPLQEYHAATFGLTQDMCNKWIHLLSPLLNKTLDEFKASRKMQDLNEHLVEGKTYIGDVTDRAIERPSKQQEESYSGKKKLHVTKNFLLCCACGFVLFLGQSVVGKVHDKKIADQQLSFKKRCLLLLDLGFQGLKLDYAQIKLPHKKPKGKELTKIQKKENQLFSRERIIIENVIAHVKIMRIVKDKNRNRKDNFRDLVMDTAVRLHNYRVTKRRITLLPESFKIA